MHNNYLRYFDGTPMFCFEFSFTLSLQMGQNFGKESTLIWLCAYLQNTSNKKHYFDNQDWNA